MYVRIKLNTVLHKNIISVPSECIVTESGKKYVYVVSENAEKLTVKKCGIEEGITVDARTEIAAGLKENDRIVVSGMQVLSDGVEVRDVNKKTE